MIRVLQMAGDLKYENGRTSMIMNIYRNIDRNKIQFDFVTSSNSCDSIIKEINDLGGKVYCLKKKLNFRNIRNFVNDILKKENYDFLEYHAISQWGVSLNIAHKYNVKVITVSHSATLSETRYKRLRNRLFSLNIFKDTDLYVAVSPEAGKCLYLNHHFEYIPNWIDIKKFTFLPSDRNEIREKLKLKKDDILIGQVGRINDNKNQLFSLKILNGLLKKNKRYHLILIGQNEISKKLYNTIKKLNLEKNVHIIEYTKNINKYYSAMDLLWLPSYFEGLPTVALEAQANGLQVLSSNRITKEIDVDRVCFLTLNSIDDWVNKTINYEKRNKDIQDISMKFEKSCFNKNKVIRQWNTIYQQKGGFIWQYI